MAGPRARPPGRHDEGRADRVACGKRAAPSCSRPRGTWPDRRGRARAARRRGREERSGRAGARHANAPFRPAPAEGEAPPGARGGDRADWARRRRQSDGTRTTPGPGRLLSRVQARALGGLPVQVHRPPDAEGWKYGSAWPPSHRAFGRLRALLAVQYAAAQRPGRVLEVAAGGGGLSAALAARGCEVVVNDLPGEVIRGAVAEFETGGKSESSRATCFN